MSGIIFLPHKWWWLHFKKFISSSYSQSKYLKLPFSFDIHANVLIFGPGFVPYVQSILAFPVHIEFHPLFHPETPSLLLSGHPYALFKILIYFSRKKWMEGYNPFPHGHTAAADCLQI